MRKEHLRSGLFELAATLVTGTFAVVILYIMQR